MGEALDGVDDVLGGDAHATVAVVTRVRVGRGVEIAGESEAAKGSTANPGERGPETGVPCRSEWKRWRSRRRGTPDELTGRSPVGGET